MHHIISGERNVAPLNFVSLIFLSCSSYVLLDFFLEQNDYSIGKLIGTHYDMLWYLKVLSPGTRENMSNSMNIAEYDNFLHCKNVWMQ